MRVLMIICLIFTLAPLAWAERYEISPKFEDFNPGDGVFEPGSRSNPYEITDESGDTVGTISPKFDTFGNDDGAFKPGSRSNPYVLETE